MFHSKQNLLAVALVLVGLVLTGCGGGGDTGNGPAPSSNTGSSGSGSSATNGGVVSSVFLQSGGSGYFSFASSLNASSQYTGVARAQLYTTSASSSVFSEQTSNVIGQYSMTTTRMTLVTTQGDYSTLGLGNDIQIDQQSANAFTYGVGGSPAILQATLTSTDVSGQAVSAVAIDANGGVAHTLAADTAAMPAGSVRYTTQVAALQPLLMVQSGNPLSQTLAQLQQQYGGTIATLGDATYLTGMTGAPALAYAQLGGSVYLANYTGANQATGLSLVAGTPYAYNQTAAAFIAQELQTHAGAL
ncbi:hypothetical protein [Burkholderia sp. BCC0322]|uniref:hypothetical protein n=1 Tax=unclassified Burkholderia TaxID=2613784 RepID=UPI00158A4D08|nr:hypothetical protein [Burkholderia sp. BCC0322]